MKSAFAMFIAVIAMAGLVTAQETFDGTTVGSTSGGSNCAAVGGWTYPAGWSEDALCGAAGPNGWRPKNGGTSSGGTGPNGDLCGSGNYMYCETSFPNNAGGVQFALYSPAGLPAGTLDFFYSMNGATIGTLDVQESDGLGGWNTVWTLTGDQGTGGGWANSGSIATTGDQIRFFYTAGTSFTGDCAIDQVSLPGDPANPTLTILSTNNADASLDINGVAGASGICEGELVSLNANIAATNAAAPHDIGLSTSPIVSGCQGIGLIDDGINLDLATTTSLYGGPAAVNLQPFGLGFGGSSMTLSFPASLLAAPVNAQMGCLDATDPDGISMSGTVTLDVAASSTVGVLTLADDGFVEINGAPATYPSCNSTAWTDVNFYGTSYTSAFVSSNGCVTFQSGTADFNPTFTEWSTQMPRVGFQSDLQPNIYGTVTYNQLADGFRVDYAAVTEWGTVGAGVTSYSIEVSATAGAALTGFTTDGTWGTSPCVMGITDGGSATGTHPGVVSFDTLGGAGAGLATDSWIDENTGGMIVGAGTTFTNVLFPTADGSGVIVN